MATSSASQNGDDMSRSSWLSADDEMLLRELGVDNPQSDEISDDVLGLLESRMENADTDAEADRFAELVDALLAEREGIDMP